MSKICSHCTEEKHIEDFSRCGDRYKNICKTCDSKRARLWYKNNKERRKEQRKQYYTENKTKLLTYSKLQYEKNREDRINYQKKYRKETGYCEYKANPERVLSNNAKYRANKLNATPCWLGEFEIFVIRQMYHKANLLSKLTGIKYHIDHIIPLKSETVCGLHTPDNLQIIPASDNLQKSNTYEVEECNYNF